MVTIDVIVPSYRLQGEYLSSILQTDIPAETTIRFIIIADNPNAEIPAEINHLVDNKKVIVIRNKENLGVCKTRNIGIENSTAEWILFVDDDVKVSKNLLCTYVMNIQNNPSAIGFVGQVFFPAPVNSFTHGIKASDVFTIFSMITHSSSVKWAPTANLLIKRSAIGTTRFSDNFPKNGAGEEIDFLLRILKTTHKELICIANAEVYHGWWYKGKRNYTRFIRWSFGSATLAEAFPEYAFYTFPNSIETFVFGLPLLIITGILLHSSLPLICFVVGIILSECGWEFIRLTLNKGLKNSIYMYEVVLIKMVNDIGRLARRFKDKYLLKGIGRRFDFLCNGKSVTNQQRLAALKFISYFIISTFLYLCYGHFIGHA